jgi:glycosyltransferase involved in cell wall biosynthesis
MTTLLAINNYYYYRGGAETVFLEHNRLFGEHGWKVVPFAMRHPKNLDSPWADYFVDEIEFGSDYSLARKVANASKVVYSFEARRKLAKLIDRVRPDVCHAHNIYHHISPSIFGLLKDRGIPTLLTLHDLKVACPAYTMLAADGICERCRGGQLYNVVRNRCIKGSALLSTVVYLESTLHRLLGSYSEAVSRFVVPSRFYVEKLVEWGMPRESFSHVPNFVQASRFEPRFDPGVAIVYFGRVSPEKGLATLVRAAAASGCKVVIAGTGSQLAELQKLASELGADVSFAGYLTGAPLHELVRSARAIVLPSEWYENAPMTVLEAYALGKPVIGARIGGIPELVREGETGLTFTSGDVEGLSAVLRDIVERPDASVAAMGMSGRRWVETEFSEERYRLKMLQVYAEVGVQDVARHDVASRV